MWIDTRKGQERRKDSPASKRFEWGARVSRVLIAAQTLLTAVTIPVLTATQPVIAAEADPIARVMLSTHSIYVLDDSEWGTAELEYTVTMQRKSGSCGGPCTGTTDKFEYTYKFNGDKDMTKSFEGAFDQLVPQYRVQQPQMYITPQMGIALFSGDELVVKWKGVEKDPVDDDYLGSVETTYTQAEGWGLGARQEVWSNDLLGSGGFKVIYDVVRSPLPDLAVANIRVGNFADNGDDIACFTVANRGTEPSGPYTAHLYVDGVVPRNGEIVESGHLAAATSQERCFQTTIAAGQHQFAAAVDEDQKVPEMNELNNRTATTATIQRAAGSSLPTSGTTGTTTGTSKPEAPSTGQADLVATSILLNETESSGKSDCDPGKNTVTVRVKNQGGTDAASFSVGLLVDSEGKTVEKKTVPSLAKGETVDVDFEDLKLKKGTHQLTAKVDADAKVSESAEGNNQLSVSVTCQNE